MSAIRLCASLTQCSRFRFFCLFFLRLWLTLSQSRVMYWLRTVAAYTSDPSRPSKVRSVVSSLSSLLLSQVVVVGTHADGETAERIAAIWAELLPCFEASGDVVAYVAVSCATGAGFDDLERGIERAMELGRLAGAMVPASFRAIELWIADPALKRQSPKLGFGDVLKQFPTLKERTVRQALEFLHDMGVCLFFERLNLVVTDPQWLATTFATLITFSHNWVKVGALQRVSELASDSRFRTGWWCRRI